MTDVTLLHRVPEEEFDDCNTIICRYSSDEMVHLRVFFASYGECRPCAPSLDIGREGEDRTFIAVVMDNSFPDHLLHIAASSKKLQVHIFGEEFHPYPDWWPSVHDHPPVYSLLLVRAR